MSEKSSQAALPSAAKQGQRSAVLSAMQSAAAAVNAGRLEEAARTLRDVAAIFAGEIKK
jgi:predicted negative regulator of RcsB-dependent stress response